jgi:hypothetical protein
MASLDVVHTGINQTYRKNDQHIVPARRAWAILPTEAPRLE